MTTKEIWKPIPGFPDYEVSDMGRVRSFRRGKVRILKTPPSDNGYCQVLLQGNGYKKNMRVHQLVMLAFVGPCPDGMEVCHGLGGQADNGLNNLRYDTHKANIMDCVKQNRMGNFTLEQVAQMRLKVRRGYPVKELAQEHGCNRGTIYNVITTGYAVASIPSFKVRESGSKRAKEMRIEYAAGGITLLELAKKYNMAESAVSHIIRGARHKDAGGPIKGIDY